ncbi:hypothetical protein MKZ38_010683 [Zalerion maritima]|uniref:Uncharacterized protein n=1 Tax=Zalerion maritima TaxID=339359 RepID=A0AAD5WSB1_9PEZI|nr:hypothetical protein MKZ38_010683 [Zalerion maritima]
MKCSTIFTAAPLFGLFAGAIASPAARNADVEKRSAVAQAAPPVAVVAERQVDPVYDILSQLYSDIKVRTGAISQLTPCSSSPSCITHETHKLTHPRTHPNLDSTAKAVPADADQEAKEVAAESINTDIATITSLVQDATADIYSLASDKKRREEVQLEARQLDPAAIVLLFGLILTEISGALNLAITAVGLGLIAAYTNPLTTALSGLILGLKLVVDGLLLLVQTLLDGILVGLTIALAGLQF